jgi:hypothetical protein
MEDGDPKKAKMVADTKSKHELPRENKQQPSLCFANCNARGITIIM